MAAIGREGGYSAGLGGVGVVVVASRSMNAKARKGTSCAHVVVFSPGGPLFISRCAGLLRLALSVCRAA